MMSNQINFQLCESARPEELEKYQSRGFIGEMKYDGTRAMAFVQEGQVNIVGRKGTNYNKQFPYIVESLKKLPNCVLDGEIVSCDFDFNHLAQLIHNQNPIIIEQLNKKYSPIFYAFDILFFEARDLRQLPLKDRLTFFDRIDKKHFLFNNLAKVEQVKDLNWLYEFVIQEQKEGLILKDLEARYEGRRTWNWIKLKNFKEMTITAESYTINNAGIRVEDNQFNAIQVAGKHSRAVKNEIDKYGSCEIIVQYLEKTKEGRLRFPSFREIKYK